MPIGPIVTPISRGQNMSMLPLSNQHNMEKRRLFNFRIHFPASSPRYSRTISTSPHLCLNKRGKASLRSPSEPRVFPRSGWEVINPSIPIEEESIPTYRPDKFYPVHIGEIFNHRYQVVGKLGYGSSATVWLCRDLL